MAAKPVPPMPAPASTSVPAPAPGNKADPIAPPVKPRKAGRRVAGVVLSAGIVISAGIGLVIVRGMAVGPSTLFDHSAPAAAAASPAPVAPPVAPSVVIRDETPPAPPAEAVAAPAATIVADPPPEIPVVPKPAAAMPPATLAEASAPATVAAVAVASESELPAPTRVVPEIAAAPPGAGAATVAKPAPKPADPSAAKTLLGEGDEQMAKGDIAAARLFYRAAVEKGSGTAALRLGNSYDPAFLKRLGVLGMQGDAAEAASWYRRARELGDPDADRALASLSQ